MKISEKTYYSIFRAGVVIKALIALGELIAGVAVLFISPARISQFIYALGGVELAEDPGDFIWKIISGGLKDFSATSQWVWSFIFLSHGIVKMFLLGGLWERKLWAYPTSALIFTGFVFYQFYLLNVTTSVLMWLITVFDIVLIGLILHEYGIRKKQLDRSSIEFKD